MSTATPYGVGTAVKVFMLDGDPVAGAAQITRVMGDPDDHVHLVVFWPDLGKQSELRSVPYNSNDDPDGPFWRFPTDPDNA